MLRRFGVSCGIIASGATAHRIVTRASSRALCGEAAPLIDELPAATQNKKFDYDLLVVGGGSGGLAAAKRAAENGAKVMLCDFVEPTNHGTSWGLGGTCVNVGCIPKKLMHQAAIHVENAEAAKSFGLIGIPDPKPKVDWQVLRENVHDYIRSLNFKYGVQLRSAEVKYVNAYASFEDPHTVRCTKKNGKSEVVTARRVLLAPGGRPTPLNIPGGEHAVTSDDIFTLPRNPGRTLVVGAGYIALECAGFLHKIGCPSTLLVRSRPLRTMDHDMGDKIASYMGELGISLKLKAKPTKIVPRAGNDGYDVTYTTESDKGKVEETTEHFDTVLAAIGRQPKLERMNVDKAGIKVHPTTQKVIVDAADRTSTPHIYAIGDVAEGGLELTPVAIHAGRLLADRLYRKGSALMSYDTVPTTVFTPLEYGYVGLSEEAATEKYAADFDVYHQQFTPLEATLPGTIQDKGYMKLLVQKSTQKVLGFHVLSPNAGEITQGVAVAMKANATKETFDNTIGIHPTIAEAMTTLSVTKASGESASGGGC